MNSSKRESSIELLRILLAAGVFLLHFNNTSSNGLSIGMLDYVNNASLNYYFYLLIVCISVCSVDAFIIISSYYLSKTNKRKINKIVFLILETIIVDVSYYLLYSIKNKTFELSEFLPCILPCNYFIVLYSVLYIISPYINIVFDSLDKKKQKRLLLISFILFSVLTFFVDITENIFNISLEGLNPVGLYGSQAGCTIINFILLYIIGSYISKNNILPKIRNSILCFFISLLISFVFLVISNSCIYIPITYYNNPIIIIMSLSLFFIFKSLKFNNLIINVLSKSAFTFYLIHAYFFPYIDKSTIANKSLIIVIPLTLVIFIVIYIVSFIFDQIYRFVFKKIFHQ